MGGDIVGLFGVIGVFGIPMLAIWTGHKQKVLKMQLELRNQVDVGTKASIEALREELRQIRDTSMQYDLSFDTALQRMEARVEGLERRINQGEVQKPAEMRLGNQG